MSITPSEFAYDVFISYSHRDQAWVRDELLPRLEKAGLKVCIDYRDFRVGAPIVKEMERAVLTNRHTLLVLTPAYLESAWTDFEALMMATFDPGGQNARLLPLLLKPCDLPLRIRYLDYADFTGPDALPLSWQRLLKALGVSSEAILLIDAPRPAQYKIPDDALDRYYEQIIKLYGWIRILGQTTPKPLRRVFTDVYMLDKPTAFNRFDPKALRAHLWERESSVPFRYSERLPADQLLSRGSKFFILGKPGAGKTTFLKHLAVREAHRGKWGACLGKIPIFVSLKQFGESGGLLFDFIAEQFAVCHFPDAVPFIEPLLQEGKALVLFDGLDEVTKDLAARTDRRSQVMEQIERFARQYDGCHIAVTCRIAATEYMFDPSFIYLELADFAPDQVDGFVRNWFWNPDDPERSSGLADRMLTEWAKSEYEGIRDLGRNPLLLTLLCLSYAETLRFPVRRVEIYEEALEALLKKWDSSRQIQRASFYKTLSPGRKQQMFSRIAYDGFAQGEILFSQSDLETRLKSYLVHVPEVPDAIDIDTEVVLREIVEQHGVFTEQSRGLFSFAHLTFQEYYVAKFIAESPSVDVFDPLLARATDDKWREVFLLTASLLRDATPFLAAFEVALHRLIAPFSPLIAWLHWNDKHAATSRATYRRPATRCWFAGIRARAFAFGSGRARLVERARDLSRSRALDLDRDLDRAIALALDLDRELDRDFDLDLVLAKTRALHLNFVRAGVSDISETLARARESCRRLDDATLAQALTDIETPRAEAPKEAWTQFEAQLTGIIESGDVLRRYRQLSDETATVARAVEARWQLGKAETDALAAYIRATQLFHDCLRLAYTPDRRAFEDRIFLPPPLTAQEA